jgi:hypothetical protein
MPKSRKNMKGGDWFGSSDTSTANKWSISNMYNDMLSSLGMGKKQNAYTPTSTSSYTAAPSYGGYKPHTNLTDSTSTATSISGVSTAKVHNWVGGKTKRRRGKKITKSRKNRK